MSTDTPLDAAAAARGRVYDEHRERVYGDGRMSAAQLRQLFDDAYTLAVSRDALIVSLADSVRAGQDGANIAHEVGKLEGRADMITALAATAKGKRGGRYVPPWIRAWIREQGAALRADSKTLDDMISKARAKQTTPVVPPPAPRGTGSTEPPSAALAARDVVARLTAEAEGGPGGAS